MQLHHSKHHATYVNNLNVAEEKLAEAVSKHDVSAAIGLQGAIKFNGGGHLNHSIFWQVRFSLQFLKCDHSLNIKFRRYFKLNNFGIPFTQFDMINSYKLSSFRICALVDLVNLLELLLRQLTEILAALKI